MPTPALANDLYRASLRSTFVDGVSTTFEVDAVPLNVPTLVTLGWKTAYEVLYRVEGKSGTSSANYALTGLTKIKGYTGNLAEGTAINCLNHEEYFNQWGDQITDVQTNVDDLGDIVNGGITTVADAATMDFDMQDGVIRKFKCSPTAARTFTLSNPLTGTYFSVRITQPGTAYNMTWFTGFTITWQGATGTTSTEIVANKTGTYVFLVTGASTLDGFLAGVSV